MAGQVFVAATTARFQFDGQPVVIAEGRTTAREGHPIMRGRESLWRPLQVTFEVDEPEEAEKVATSKRAVRTAKSPAGA